MLQLCKDGRQPCSQTQDPTPSDMIDGKIWRAVFCIHHFAFLLSHPLYGIVQEHTLTSEKNIVRVQNCPDITILYSFLVRVIMVWSWWSGRSGRSGWSGESERVCVCDSQHLQHFCTVTHSRCTHLRLSSEASPLLSPHC